MSQEQLTGRQCQCAECGKYFSSETAFDRHRVGNYASPGQLKGNRRCLSTAEMLCKGLLLNKGGFWVTRLRQGFPSFLQGAPEVEPLPPYRVGVDAPKETDFPCVEETNQ